MVVVSYGSGPALSRSLPALQGYPVLVVDNASADDSVAVARRFSHVTVLALLENRGFAGGVNAGFEATDWRRVLILNPDVVVEPKAVARLEAVCDEFGLAGGQLLGANGEVQQGFVVRRLPTVAMLVAEVLGWNALWPGNPWNRAYRALDLDLTRAQVVEQPAGAMLMVRRDVWQALGGFDERFWPVWFEDVDFCQRARVAGYRIGYEPAARGRHEGGHSVKNVPPLPRRLYWYGSLFSYAAKHFGLRAARFVSVAIGIGLIIRWGAGVLRVGKPDSAAVYRQVVRSAFQSAWSGRNAFRIAPGTKWPERIEPEHPAT